MSDLQRRARLRLRRLWHAVRLRLGRGGLRGGAGRSARRADRAVARQTVAIFVAAFVAGPLRRFLARDRRRARLRARKPRPRRRGIARSVDGALSPAVGFPGSPCDAARAARRGLRDRDSLQRFARHARRRGRGGGARADCSTPCCRWTRCACSRPIRASTNMRSTASASRQARSRSCRRTAGTPMRRRISASRRLVQSLSPCRANAFPRAPYQFWIFVIARRSAAGLYFTVMNGPELPTIIGSIAILIGAALFAAMI